MCRSRSRASRRPDQTAVTHRRAHADVARRAPRTARRGRRPGRGPRGGRAFLEPRARSVAEVRRRLTGAGYRADLVDGVIERLLEFGMLDDEAFARAWVESRDRARPRGERAIRRSSGSRASTGARSTSCSRSVARPRRVAADEGGETRVTGSCRGGTPAGTPRPQPRPCRRPPPAPAARLRVARAQRLRPRRLPGGRGVAGRGAEDDPRRGRVGA